MPYNKKPPMEGYYYNGEGSALVVEGDPCVLLTGAIVLVKNGTEYSIDAEFDLSDLPPELHEMAIQIMMSLRQRVLMGI